MSRKLMAKGNERLPFAWRSVLCEGEDDVEAIYTLADRLGVGLRGQNIAVADCGGRDNLPDYIRFCAELGLHYLAVMDADTSKGKLNAGVARKAGAVRDAVKKYQNGELVEFPEDMETTLSITKQRPSLVSEAIKAARLDSSGPPELVELVSAMFRIGRRE
jgi:predicted ATP-dependent endonuclease of OLD family